MKKISIILAVLLLSGCTVGYGLSGGSSGVYSGVSVGTGINF